MSVKPVCICVHMCVGLRHKHSDSGTLCIPDLCLGVGNTVIQFLSPFEQVCLLLQNNKTSENDTEPILLRILVPSISIIS